MQATVQKELHILILEDSATDAELNERELRKAGIQFTSKRVDTREAFSLALKSFHPDLILSDYNLPGFSGIAALGMVRHDCPQIPVIFVTGALSDAEAANLINAGAKDYVLKDRLARLAPAVQRALSVEQGVRIRKLTEVQLQEKTELLENVINSSQDYIFVKDRELRTILCNRMFAQALGKKPEDLYGKTDIENGWDAELVKGNPEKGIRGFEQDDLEALAGNVVRSTTDMGNIHGETRNFDSIKVPLKSADGHIFGMLGISRDITEQKQIELRDKALIHRNQVLMQSTSEGIHVLDDRGNVIEVNNAFCRHLGYTEPEILKLGVFDFEANLSADELRENLRKYLDGHAVFETVHRRKDGSLVDVEISISGVELDGQKCLFCLSRDISERKRAEHELLENEHRLKEAQRIAHFGSWEWDIASGANHWSDEQYRIFGHEPGTVSPDYDLFMQALHPDDRNRIREALDATLEDRAPYSNECRIVLPDGSLKHIHCRGEVERDASGKPVRMAGTVLDITERIKSEERLRLTAKVFENTMEGITVTDKDGNILEVNEAFTRITGYPRDEVIGKNPRILKSGLQDKAFYEAMWRLVMTTGHWRGDLYNRRKDGEIYPETLTLSAITDNKGRVTNFVGVFADITLLKQHEKQLEHIAHYDALTGIPNRVLLADRIKQAIAYSKREKTLLAVCYLDLDGFKAINDSMGHEAGDQVLIEISRRIKDTVREGDTVARLGGDEFVILLTGLGAPEEYTGSLDRLLDTASRPVSAMDRQFKLSASIGVSLYPLDGNDPDTLLRHADQAMYTAKQSGKNRYYLYDVEHDQRARTQNELMKRISQGLKDDEFELFYQPKVDLKSGRPVGAEGLIRWRHPERGLVSPAEFLPAIEDTELDIEVGEWVIAAALGQLAAWQQAGLDLELSINISAFHMQSAEFSAKLRRSLSQYPDLPRDRLQIEILETAALKDFAAARRIIEACRDFDVKFALDDFGTGYSSLSYLSNLPVDTLKIDQSFIRDMLEDDGDFAIVEGIIALSRAFNLKTVAEGVATDKCFSALLEMGCEIGQGYAIAHPMPAADFMAWHRQKTAM